MLNIIFWTFVAVTAVQFVYYVVVFGKFAYYKAKRNNPKRIPVSVIVCAKNEEENVRKFVPLLAEQDYPDFEIVLIDDASSDETLEVFEEYERRYPNIKLVKVANNEAFWGNKKFALTLGIKAASKDYLLFTDADCYPASTTWIAEMTSHFTLQKTIVLGYGAYEKVPNSFLNKLIRYETLLTAVQYFSYARCGNPYMGVGRNLAYKKSEFFSVDGFRDHMKIRSGDDDLFINQVANKRNTTICYTPESFTSSEPKKSFRDWFAQKRRHVSTAGHYKAMHRFLLGTFFCSQFFFIVLAAVLLAFLHQWIAVTAIVGFRYLFAWLTMGLAAGKLREKDTIYFFPVIELALILTQLNIFISNTFSKPVHWK